MHHLFPDPQGMPEDSLTQMDAQSPFSAGFLTGLPRCISILTLISLPVQVLISRRSLQGLEFRKACVKGA